jgi:hypothetical protein
MDGWMDGSICIDGYMDGRVDGWMGGWMDMCVCMYVHAHERCPHRRRAGVHRWMDGWINR